MFACSSYHSLLYTHDCLSSALPRMWSIETVSVRNIWSEKQCDRKQRIRTEQLLYIRLCTDQFSQLVHVWQVINLEKRSLAIKAIATQLHLPPFQSQKNFKWFTHLSNRNSLNHCLGKKKVHACLGPMQYFFSDSAIAVEMVEWRNYTDCYAPPQQHHVLNLILKLS